MRRHAHVRGAAGVAGGSNSAAGTAPPARMCVSVFAQARVRARARGCPIRPAVCVPPHVWGAFAPPLVGTAKLSRGAHAEHSSHHRAPLRRHTPRKQPKYARPANLTSLCQCGDCHVWVTHSRLHTSACGVCGTASHTPHHIALCPHLAAQARRAPKTSHGAPMACRVSGMWLEWR